MLKTLYDPVVEEKGRQEGKEEGKEEGLKESVHFFLADYNDYDEYKQMLDEKLKPVKDISRLQEILKISARATAAVEVIKFLSK